jgi:hypothetical protein
MEASRSPQDHRRVPTRWAKWRLLAASALLLIWLIALAALAWDAWRSLP